MNDLWSDPVVHCLAIALMVQWFVLGLLAAVVMGRFMRHMNDKQER